MTYIYYLYLTIFNQKIYYLPASRNLFSKSFTNSVFPAFLAFTIPSFTDFFKASISFISSYRNDKL